MTEPSICPTCGNLYAMRPIQPLGKRVCSLCGGRIKKRHRWEFGPDSRARHRDCKNPTGIPETDKPKEMFE